MLSSCGKRISFKAHLSKYWGSSFSINRQIPNLALWAILGKENSLSRGLKLLLYHSKAYGCKDIEKEIPVFSWLLPKHYHSIIILRQGYYSVIILLTATMAII